MPTRGGYGGNRREPDYDMLLQALLEQERNDTPGQVPSGMATNAYLESIPLTREQGREANVLGEADRRYFQNREDDRKRLGDLADAQSNASVRGFERRTGVAEEQGPMRTIRRFGSSGEFTDPDAARGAREKAMDDPRVLAAETQANADAIVASAKSGQAKADSDLKASEDMATRNEVMRLAEQLRDSPDLNANVGPLDVWIPTMRGKSYKFQQDVDRLRSLLSLGARSKLKGSGTVTDLETNMLTKSESALDRSSDEGSFRAELDRIIEEQRRRNAPATGRVE